MTRKNLLIDPSRVLTGDYYRKWRQEFRLTGFIAVQPYTAPPDHDTWTKKVYNRFCAVSHEAYVDGKPCFVLPVFVNDQPVDALFDGEKVADPQKPSIAFFLGNDDWHYAMRFESNSERQKMLEFFGEDLGLLENDLIGHN